MTDKPRQPVTRSSKWAGYATHRCGVQIEISPDTKTILWDLHFAARPKQGRFLADDVSPEDVGYRVDELSRKSYGSKGAA